MKILYYTWQEYTAADMVDSLRQLGHQVDVVSYKIKDYDMDMEFMEWLEENIRSKDSECVFTANYIPAISRVTEQMKCIYISWVFDSPHLTLNSKTVGNSCNYIFIFDRQLCEKLKTRGIDTVYHQPLAVNTERLSRQFAAAPVKSFEHEVTFVGTLYDDEHNFFDQIQYMPENLRGYIDGLIESQLLIYGYDMVGEVFKKSRVDELLQYTSIDMGENFYDERGEILRDMIRKKATVVERRRLLMMLGSRFEVDLYAPEEPKNMPVHYKGYTDYNLQMPRVFASSKINLNITLRSILSGLPLRVIDILGAGGFLLTNYQEEMTDYFENGTDLVWYESPQDMVEKVDFYLRHEQERKQIAANGHARVREEFSYINQLSKIMKKII